LVGPDSSPPRPISANTLFSGPLQQLLRQLLLIDDLARHRIDHHLGSLSGRVRHGPSLSIGSKGS
jgi:hypothetical protein